MDGKRQKTNEKTLNDTYHYQQTLYEQILKTK